MIGIQKGNQVVAKVTGKYIFVKILKNAYKNNHCSLIVATYLITEQTVRKIIYTIVKKRPTITLRQSVYLQYL